MMRPPGMPGFPSSNPEDRPRQNPTGQAPVPSAEERAAMVMAMAKAKAGQAVYGFPSRFIPWAEHTDVNGDLYYGDQADTV